MLQQILKDMYIDPELLAELDDEQKQVLFCKMREEQVRRYNEWEANADKENIEKTPKKNNKKGKKVGFLSGKDGNPWVWVMGDHEEDISIEEILEKEALAEAEKQAEKEAETRKGQGDKDDEKKIIADENDSEKSSVRENNKSNILRKKKPPPRPPPPARSSSSLQVEQTDKKQRRRSMEIYMSLKEARQSMAKEAEKSSKKIEAEWKEQEKRVKEADAERKAIARRARQEHRRSMMESFRSKAKLAGSLGVKLKESEKRHTIVGVDSALINEPILAALPPRPSCKADVIEWFKKTECPKQTGIHPSTNKVQSWFHGIITRPEAEALLEDFPPGSFLVRVSERIWGYAISYKTSTRCKHFLIDAASGKYQFFGTNQITHDTLADLISFHIKHPISQAGQERLKKACAQREGSPPDYKDLFEDDESATSYL